MAVEVYWFLPAHGDGREVAKRTAGTAPSGARREPDIDYLAQITLAVDRLGFHGILVPFGLFCEDPWVVASALAGLTRRARFLIALRPGSMSPLTAAQSAATFQRLSGGRLELNIVTGGDADEQHRYGDWLAHDQRYERTGEFLDVFHRAWSGGPFDFAGTHYRIAKGLLTRPHPVQPRLFLGGSSDSALRMAVRHADALLNWGEAPPATGESVIRLRALARRSGRTVSFGTRLHVITRASSASAREIARRLVDGIDPARISQAQQRFRASESEGQRRMTALHTQADAALEIYPNVWTGYGLVRPGVGTALLGSHEEVAERIEEYHALGVEHLILSAQPHLEEAYEFGEGVLPLLRRRGILAP